MAEPSVLGGTAAGDCHPAVLPVRKNIAPRPEDQPLAPGGAGGAGGQFHGTGRSRGAHPGRRHPHAPGVRHAVHDLPHGLCGGRHHRPPGRQPGRHGHLSGDDQPGGHLPHPAGDSAGEPVPGHGLLDLCGPPCPQGIPGPHPAGPAGLAHPLHYAPSPAAAHALVGQFLLRLGRRAYPRHGHEHPRADPQPPGRWRHHLYRPRFHGLLRHPVRGGPPPGGQQGRPAGRC